MAHPETIQQREFNKYYLPWLRSVPTDSLGTTSRCLDTTLTALAQLATLRLRVETGAISLLDETKRILLAKAGKFSPLRLNIEDVEEKGVQQEPPLQLKHLSLDQYVVGSKWQSWPSIETAEREEHVAFVVNNVAEDPRLSNTTSLPSEHSVGFYAGVPIVSTEGFTIGVLSVSDPLPRPDGPTFVEVEFLQDIARIVFDHLDKNRYRMNQIQGEGLVKGLTSFVEELSAYKLNIDHPEDTALESQNPDHADDVRATDSHHSTPRGRSKDKSPSRHSETAEKSPERSHSACSGHSKTPELKHTMETNGSKNQDLDKALGNMKRVFGSAAHSIREATGAHGCIFFDASPSLFAGASSAQPARASSTESSRFTLESDSSDNENFRQSGHDQSAPASARRRTLSHRRPSKIRRSRAQQPAAVLGASLAHSEISNLQQYLSQRDLKRCLRRYPHGEWFWFPHDDASSSDHPTEDAIVTGDVTSTSEPKPHIPASEPTRRFRTLPESLLSNLSKARWLIFLPLFNYAHQQWYAGGFVWSNEPDFHGLDTHIPYLKAFGSCIMSEVTGMEALNTTLARTTFIASISHDLRSPLHGMLGNLEFLEDTLTSAYQVSLAGSIETCGKTLLDTIDHLLDYAKINNLNRATDKTGSKQSSQSLETSTPKPTVDFDLALLLEEVTEAAFVGQTFRKKNLRERDAVDHATDMIHSLAIDDSKSTEQSVHQGSAKFSGKVFFIVDIEHIDSWLVRAESPGAIRRVILNIIGNAIKYCNSGVIEAKLWKPEIEDGKADVKISIKDSGIGMSQAFMENHLFKAFSQENSFAAGAGLGLSIARQLVDQMHGNISVKSEKGIGTHVDISLPLLFEPGTSHEHQDILQTAVRLTTGKKICLLNPGAETDIVTKGQSSKLTTSIAEMCESWFNLEFTESTTIDAEVGSDIFVYAEPPPIEYLIEHHSQRRAAGKDGREVALLIICTNAFEAAALRSAGVSQLISLGRVIEVISQPVGIRKLAKVLLSSFQRIEASATAETDSAPSGTTGVPAQTVSAEAKRGSPDTQWSSSPVVYDPISKSLRPSIEAIKWKSEQVQVRKPTDQSNMDSADLEFGQIKAGALPGEVPMLPKVAEDSGGEARMPNVLVVDDNPINLRLLITFMKKIRLPYVEAVNGLEAFNKFKDAEVPFDFVLMDLQMPVMDGLESTRRIREHEKQVDSSHPATIIAITGVGSESVKNDCMESGMTQFLTKPVKFKTLQQLLERHNRL